MQSLDGDKTICEILVHQWTSCQKRNMMLQNNLLKQKYIINGGGQSIMISRILLYKLEWPNMICWA